VHSAEINNDSRAHYTPGPTQDKVSVNAMLLTTGLLSFTAVLRNY